MKIARSLFMCIVILLCFHMHAISFSYSSNAVTTYWLIQYAKDHPIITIALVTAAFLGLSYAYVQIPKPVKINLIEYKPHDFNAKKESFLFAAGIAETHNQAFWYAKKTDDLPWHRYQDLNLPYTMDGRIFTYDYPDSTHWFWRVNWTQTSLGQRNEIESFKKAYQAAVERTHNNENRDFIFYGMSRGATTILNFMGMYANKPEYVSRVKAMVLESPFSSTKDLATHMLGRVGDVPGMSNIAHSLMSVAFWQHDINGPQAIDLVKNIPLNLPILFICSKQDSFVPVSSTIELYKALRNSGHTNVHIFVADHGTHGRILHNKDVSSVASQAGKPGLAKGDGVRYQNVVQAFYRKYGLHHDSELADLGQADFEMCLF